MRSCVVGHGAGRLNIVAARAGVKAARCIAGPEQRVEVRRDSGERLRAAGIDATERAVLRQRGVAGRLEDAQRAWIEVATRGNRLPSVVASIGHL